MISTPQSPRSLQELQDLLKDDIKVKVAGEEGRSLSTGPFVYVVLFLQASMVKDVS